MAITAAAINALRAKTGQGMMDCKKALTEADGDEAKAIELLREWAGGKMDEREAEAGEGTVKVAKGEGAIAIAAVKAETDFSARNEMFQNKTQEIAEMALASGQRGKFEPTADMAKAVEDLRVTIQENIAFEGVARLEGPKVGSYVHNTGKIGVILAAEGDFSDELLSGLCMHIAAAVPPVCPAPLAIDEADLPAEQVAAAKAEFVKEAQDSGKPAEIAEKMAMGKMNKWVSEHTLLGQNYIRDMDAKKPVKDYLPAGGKVLAYVRLAIGG